MTDLQALALEVRALRAELAEVGADVADLVRRQATPEDRRAGAVLVPLAGEVMGPRAFAPGEFVKAAGRRRDAVGQAVLETLHERDLLDDDGGFRTLGRLFRRVQRIAFDGFRLVPEGGRWRVVSVARNGEQWPG
ncbi:MAG: hypothetical protein KIT17_15435 [Rubrivivax sp.]|nr:hypothetical protein [Rubrivivax sp.]